MHIWKGYNTLKIQTPYLSLLLILKVTKCVTAMILIQLHLLPDV